MIDRDESTPNEEVTLGLNGKTVTMRGSYTTIIMIIMGLTLFIGWLLWNVVSAGNTSYVSAAITKHGEQTSREHVEIRQTLEAQTQVLKEQRELQEEQNYMLFFATPEEKRQLQDAARRPARFQRWMEEERRHGR